MRDWFGVCLGCWVSLLVVWLFGIFCLIGGFCLLVELVWLVGFIWCNLGCLVVLLDLIVCVFCFVGC